MFHGVILVDWTLTAKRGPTCQPKWALSIPGTTATGHGRCEFSLILATADLQGLSLVGPEPAATGLVFQFETSLLAGFIQFIPMPATPFPVLSCPDIFHGPEKIVRYAFVPRPSDARRTCFRKRGTPMKDRRTWFSWEPPSGSLGSTSPSLVDAYRSGDSESWKRVVDIYGPVVYHIFLSKVAPADRDDVFQEVFSTAWRNRERFNKVPGRPSFRAWLHRIAANTVLNHQRDKRRHQCAAPVGGDEHDEMMEHFPVHDPAMLAADESEASASPAEDTWNEWLDIDRDVIVEGVSPDGDHIRILVRQQVLRMVLQELESQPRTRNLALRQIINGESAEAAARALGTNAGAAYTAKSRVLKRAREVLSELGEPVGDGRESPDKVGGVEP